MYDLIIFDLSGVIFTNGMITSVPKISRLTNCSEKDVSELLKGAFAENYFIGLEDPNTFWEKLGRRLNFKGEKLRNLWFGSYKLIEANLLAVRDIQNKGIKTACLSESPSDRVKYHQKKYKFLNSFDYTVFSYETHTRKPSQTLFDLLQKKYPHNPSNSLYIDDDPNNLKIPESIGYEVLLYEDEDTLKST